MLRKIQVYIDGGCKVNPGNSCAWGIKIVCDEQLVLISSGVKIIPTTQETSGRAEAYALCAALQKLLSLSLSQENINIYSDSTYIIRCAQQIFQYNVNKDIWEKIILQLEKFPHKSFHWIKGHNNDPNNELVDRLANSTYILTEDV